MNFRNIDLKDRIVRRVYHRFLIVVSGVLFIALFSIIPHVADPSYGTGGVRRVHPPPDKTYSADDAFVGAFGGSILFYATGHALYWGVYWVMQGFQPTPRPNPFLKLFRRLRGDYEEDDYSSLYMLRIIRDVAGDHGFSSSTLLEDTFLADGHDSAKRICLRQAQRFLSVSEHALAKWQESDIGFEIRHGDIRVMLITDVGSIPQPPVGDAIEVSPR